MNVGLLFFLLNGITGAFGLVMSPILLLNILLSTVLAVYYFKLHTIVYLRLTDNSLSIHKGLVYPRKKVDLSEIEQGRLSASKLILLLKNEKEIDINLSLLTIKDYEKLHAMMLHFFPIQRH
ncbi:hypothetical protein I2483_01015 [Sporosarcina sp. E16_3]|uniref:hypothetical protein n=1 Tax=Sporosarcina sp. E16_3 TaxID=2789293 RepID=UPI001A923FC2|nr:hypothetical protein [Sporosarcina sp. E16_3]MBO0600228.1 hypothetical protein [Sporosarcina sp. E16_3]